MAGTSQAPHENSGAVPVRTVFEKLFEFSPDAIAVTDKSGRISNVNSQLERLFGYDRQELLGQPVEILVPERFRQIHPKHRSDYNAQPHTRPMGAGLQLYGLRKDGTEFPVDIMLSPVETGEGQAVLSVIRDVSERKRAEEKLRESEQQFRSLFEFSPDAIVVTDQDGKIAEVNGQIEKLFGYQRDELLGQPVEILVPERFRRTHPDHRNKYNVQPHTRPMGAGLELYGRRKDGTEFPVDIMLSPVETERGRTVLTVVRDISQRRRAELALRQSEALLRSLVENAKDYAILMLDPQGQVVNWSPGAERIMGYPAKEIVGQHFSRFYTQEDTERGKPAHELSVAAAQGRVEEEGWRVRQDGSRFWANTVITAVRDHDGKLLGFSKVTRDFTERKKADDSLLLELSHALLSSLDIQNLLTAISAGIQQAVPNDYSAIALEEANDSHLHVHVLKEPRSQGPSPEVRLPIKDTPSGHVFTTREPLRLGRFDAPGFSSVKFDHLTKIGQKSGCWLPLVSRDRALGTLIVCSRREDAFTQNDLDTLRRVASQIAVAVDNALAFRQISELSDKLTQEKRYLEEELITEYRFEDIIGESVGLKRVLKQVETVAATDVTVLVLGETGTGKDLVARSIHHLSSRRDRSLIKLNCAAIPTGLLESELFGHEKGAFTGAISQKIGRLELAHQGTLFLDEVGDLPLELQPKILRALQEKEFERLGGTRTIPVDVRLIAATNRNLEKMVANREFRSDLYYRLRVFPVTIPSLRERRDDIPLLVRYFVAKHARRLSRRIETIPAEVMNALTRWSWPGNIRELENFIERAVILSQGPTLRAPLAELDISEEPSSVHDTTLESTERDHILRILRETKGVIAGPKGAAARLGLKRTTLNSKLKKLGIERSDYI
jgi:formate hydrogenlyase transcriptional activator